MIVPEVPIVMNCVDNKKQFVYRDAKSNQSYSYVNEKVMRRIRNGKSS